MLRVNYLLTGVGILLSIATMILEQSPTAFLLTIIPYIGSMVVIYLNKKSKIEHLDLLRSTIITSWATIYNVLYIGLRLLTDMNLYIVEWKFFLQLFIPFAIGTILKYKYTTKNISSIKQ